MLLASLFLVMGTAWAQTSYTIDPTTGTANKDGYFATWTYTTSDANPAALTLAVQGGANNMKYDNNQLQLWVGSGCTYTIQVPIYYRIVSYSFDFVRAGTYSASESVKLTVDDKELTATTETQTVTVNNVNAASTSFKMTGSNKGIIVTNFVVNVERFIELTTDPENPRWYAIKNVRCGNYVYHNGDGGQMQLKPLTGASRNAGRFYFTGEMNADGTEYTVKIHNAATTNFCAAHNSWTEAGIDWYIKLSSNTANPGFAISNSADYSDNGTSWNDAGGNGTSVAFWNGGDPGSTWEFVPASEYDFPKMSTTENPILYSVRNVRQYGKYANYVAEGSVLTQVSTSGLGSYWYFVAADETAPEGWVACKIYNAANAKSLQNPNGTFGDQVYYIKKHEWDNNIGFAIKRSTGNGWDGWNDSNGSTVVDYDANDAGSIWWIEKAPKTAAQLMSEATTAKTNALNAIGVYEFADYYTYSDEAIATAKAVINAANTDDVAAAVSGHMSIEQALSTLRSTDKGTEGPKAGDFIRIKNKEGRGYMKHVTDETRILGTNEATEISSDVTVWVVESAGDESSNVKLRNLATGKYLGELRNNTGAKVTDESGSDVSGHNKFAWTNINDCYAVFKDVSGGDGAYAHMGNGTPKILIGYNTGDAASYWLVDQVTAAEALADLQTSINTVNQTFGTNPGFYRRTDALTTALTSAQTLIDEESTDVGGILGANKSLQTAFAEADASKTDADIILPEAGKYYRIKNNGGTGYLSSGTNGITQFVAGIGEDASSIFYYDNDKKLVSYDNGYYLGLGGNNSGFIHYTSSSANGTDITFKKSPVVGKLLIEFKGEDRSFYSGGTGGSNAAGSGQTGDNYRFTVEEVDMITVTVKYMYKGAELADLSVEKLVEAGSTYTVANPYANTKTYIAIGECSATDSQPVYTDGAWSVTVTEAETVTVTLVDDLPFKVSESYGTATWYFMNIRSDNKKYVAMSDDTPYSNTKNSPDEKGLWAFMGDAKTGIKVINKAAGEGKTLSYEGDAAGDKAVVMREEEKTWTIERANTGFLLRAGNTGNLYVHDLGGYLKIWNSTSAPADLGSAFNVVEDKGVKDLTELALNPRYIDIYTIQAERSPLMYSATETTKLSSGLVSSVAASETDVNQQFLIIRTPSTPAEYFYLYSLGAEKFVDENLNFIDYPSPVFSLEPSGHTVYPWRVKIDNKYVIPGDDGTDGTDGNKIYHTTGGEDDEGKRYRIVKVGQSYEHYNLLTKIEEAEDMIKLPSALSLDKVYTVSTYDEGYWYYNSEQDALWSTEKAGVEPSSQDINQQFAFLTVAGHTYLYSMGAQKFVIKNDNNTAYSDVPSQAIELLDAEGSRFYPFVAAFVNGEERYHIGISNGYDIPVITFYNDLNDHGNKIKLREVTPGYMPGNAAELLSAAVTKIDNYLAARELKPELEALLAQAQALLDKNYLDAEDATLLTNAKNDAQTVYDDETSNSTVLNEQIGLLTEAIAAATTVRAVADFQNNYVYTLVSPRGWLGAADDNDNLISANNGTADDDNFHWAVYKSEGGKYYLYNIGKGMFMGTVSSGDLPFAAKPQSTELAIMATDVATYPIMFSTDGGSSSVNHGNSDDEVINATVWGSGCSYPTDEGNTHKVTVAGQIDANVLAAIKGAVDVLEATQALGDAIAAVQAKADNMDKLGYYSSSSKNFTAEFNEIKAFKDAITEGTTVDAINDQITAANNLVETFTVLNVPQAGKFYRIKNNDGTGYLSSGTGSGRTQFVANIGESASSLFYYDGKLLSYANGMYLGVAPYNGKNFIHYTETLGREVGTTIHFKESPVLGKLLVEFDNENRSFYSANTGNSNAADKGQTGDSYRFTVEEVTSLPVTITAAQVSIKNEEGENETKCISTFYAPVALDVPAGVIACTGQVVDNYLALNAIGSDVIPANTGVILLANESNESVTYNFSIHTGVVDPIADNDIMGSVAKTLVAPEDGYNCYVLANGDDGVGLYKAQLNQSNNTAFLNNACKAYLPVSKPAVDEPAQAARAFTMRFGRNQGGTTEIEGSELDAQGSQLIYDLQGRRVLNPTKGMYIVNGKKVIFK